jgi:hypothetical protein
MTEGFAHTALDEGQRPMTQKLAAFSIAAFLALAAATDAGAADLMNGGGGGSVKDGMAGVPVPVPRPVAEAFNYYVRVDMGYGKAGKKGSLSESGAIYGDGSILGLTRGAAAGADFGYGGGVAGNGFSSTYSAHGYDGGFIAGFGAGAYLTSRVRGDLTVDFRTDSKLGSGGTYTHDAWDRSVTPYVAVAGTRVDGSVFETVKIGSTVAMFNGYMDLSERGAFTPYIGGGFGVTFNRYERTTTNSEHECGCAVTTPTPTIVTTTSSANKVGIAAAGVVGFSYAFDHTKALDVNYRLQYIQGGEVAGTSHGNASTLKASDLWEHQLRAGLRWNIW